jgi:hypothetical protein
MYQKKKGIYLWLLGVFSHKITFPFVSTGRWPFLKGKKRKKKTRAIEKEREKMKESNVRLQNAKLLPIATSPLSPSSSASFPFFWPSSCTGS